MWLCTLTPFSAKWPSTGFVLVTKMLFTLFYLGPWFVKLLYIQRGYLQLATFHRLLVVWRVVFVLNTAKVSKRHIFKDWIIEWWWSYYGAVGRWPQRTLKLGAVSIEQYWWFFCDLDRPAQGWAYVLVTSVCVAAVDFTCCVLSFVIKARKKVGLNPSHCSISWSQLSSEVLVLV